MKRSTLKGRSASEGYGSASARRIARTRGQVMVLGAVALLVMALMLMASFSVSNAIHEKIRIQAHADAQAYSLAVLEARSFNTISHYNRAIAATLVAQMSLHSWMAIATANVSQLVGEAQALDRIIAYETMLGCTPPHRVAHCPCVAMAQKDKLRVDEARQQWTQTLQGKEQDFNTAVSRLKEMADALYASQRSVLQNMWNNFQPDSTVMSALRTANASKSEYSGLTELNRGEFACALEGSPYDTVQCPQRKQREKIGAQKRSAIMLHAADAARPPFLVQKDVLSTIVSQNWKRSGSGTVPQSLLSTGRWQVSSEETSAGVSHIQQLPSPGDNPARTAGAVVTGSSVRILRYRHTPSATGSGPQGRVFSDSNGGTHQSVVSDSNHREFKGVVMEDPCEQSNCFVNFRAWPMETGDFGQPSVYGGASQNLRLYHLKTDGSGTNGETGDYKEHAPWEINKDGKIKIEIQRGKPALVNYVARGEGYAVSKARVYFHQLGDWKAPPNFFDPFWRAKLHFFSRDELGEILRAAGDRFGVQYVNAGAPAEGSDQ
jgi:hypothetical protein